MNWLEFPDAAQQTSALANSVASRLSAAIESRGQAVLAVSGGKSPIPFFQLLSEMAIDWARITVTLVDERFVAPDHVDSNAALVRRHLLTGRAAPARFLPLVREIADIAAEVAVDCHEFIAPDVAILGMGEDGHTASLFPGAAELVEGLDPEETRPLLAVTPPAAPHRRISMSYAALLQAGCLVLSIQGAKKREVFDAALREASDALPISHFLAQTRVPVDVYWSA
ncbi:6-phosphogluconolactonase [Chromobacterium sphagni]|uniref:6-phosphogluconolactonase n=1 Tax=Chromobacterium sphagni TaxID=1903179 RepID=A0A1S1WYE4_9NEIS|nr:6-phosphogluconolactonase [Chromobacterium sphagni]OHX12159.1 6-phosphogluconolactonase [Chromobacterium sphagni]OHX21756.1 6-phosphogluconolactonase [Chromobacterium sphagni]